MDNCQPEQSIEPHTICDEDEDQEFEEENEEEQKDDEEKELNDDQQQSTSTSIGQKRKKNLFVPEMNTKSKKGKQLLNQTMDDISSTLGTLAEAIKDNSSQELVTFLKEDAIRQQARDQMFMTLMQTMVMGPRSHFIFQFKY